MNLCREAEECASFSLVPALSPKAAFVIFKGRPYARSPLMRGRSGLPFFIRQLTVAANVR